MEMEPPKVIVDQFMKFWYWYVSRKDKQSEITFMNYGYSDHSDLELAEADENNRYPLQLYDYITRDHSLSDRHVLEVGSGRGGGAEYLTRSHQPRSFKGLDLNKTAVNFCNRYYSHEQLSFKQGNALDIPFEDSSFDVVLNVESSHRYPDVDRFFSEVHRVLKPGGVFLFTDFRDDFLLDRLDDQISNSPLQIQKKELITDYVVKALELDTDRREDLIVRLSPLVFRGIARAFSGHKGTRMYRWFKSGRVEYFYYVLHKTT